MISREKNKITYLHFILSVLVILIHSINNDTKFERVFSIDNGIGQFAVPLFFILSGFLFFRNAKNMIDVKMKLRKRIYTLLIPYLIWNVIYYVIHLLFNPGVGVSINELFNAAFNYKYNPAFWFMYQLILLTMISPILLYFLKAKIYIIVFYIVMIMLVVFNHDIPYINEDAMIYYFTGAVFSILYNRNRMQFISKANTFFAFIVVAITYVINRYLYRLLAIDFGYRTIFTLSIIAVRLAMAFTIFYFIDIVFNYTKVPKFMGQNFFLYAIHYAIVKGLIIIMKFLMYKFAPSSIYVYIEIAVFVMSPIICVMISYHASNYMIKNHRAIYDRLTGGRS